MITTDSQGQAVFDVPFSAPADLPYLTATATDPVGNTSEVSALRLEPPDTHDGGLARPGSSFQFRPSRVKAAELEIRMPDRSIRCGI